MIEEMFNLNVFISTYSNEKYKHLDCHTPCHFHKDSVSCVSSCVLPFLSKCLPGDQGTPVGIWCRIHTVRAELCTSEMF